MSSSNRTPFQDITNGQNLDPKEVKRHRDREYYAKKIFQSAVAKKHENLRNNRIQRNLLMMKTRYVIHQLLENRRSPKCNTKHLQEVWLWLWMAHPTIQLAFRLLWDASMFLQINLKRQRERERYSSMSNGQKEACLHNNREYKKLVREHNSPFITSHSTPLLQTQSSKIMRTDAEDTMSDDESDHAEIFEPFEQGATLEALFDFADYHGHHSSDEQTPKQQQADVPGGRMIAFTAGILESGGVGLKLNARSIELMSL